MNNKNNQYVHMSTSSKIGDGFINNLTIGKKLFLNTAVILTLTILLSFIVALNFVVVNESIKTMSSKSEDLHEPSKNMTKAYFSMPISIYSAIAFGQTNNIERRDQELENARKAMFEFEDQTKVFVESCIVHYPEGSAENNFARELSVDAELYLELFNQTVDLVQVGNYNGAIKIITNNAETVTKTREMIDKTNNMSVDVLIYGMHEIQHLVIRSIIFLVVALLTTLILSIFVARKIAGKIKDSIQMLLENVEHLRKGNFRAITASNSRDEIGQVTRSFVEVVDIIENIVEDIQACDTDYERGTLQPRIDPRKYDGSYLDFANSVNHIFKTNAEKIGYIMMILEKFADGSFDFNRTDFPGEQKILTDAMFTCVDNIMKLNTKIITMTENANNGNLEQINTEGFKNSWLTILEHLNKLLVTIEVPIHEVNSVLSEMALGNLSATINGNYKGVFNDMKSNVNTSVMAVNSAIRETNDSLAKIADNDLNFKITTEYKGDFNKIKFAINSILVKLNKVFAEFVVSANSVTDIASQLSSSSVNIANGATEQATSIEELNVAVEGISNNTKENAKKSANARDIANNSVKNAVRGDSEMKTMLKAMEEIKAASDNIANIISVIDNIAFQTNLLALNAAVEAASAGQHGKGFAVVAEEVRSLAARSKEAASQTASLINESLRKVNLGNELANSTAVALNEIVTSVSQVSGLLDEISISSNEQAVAISEIVTNLGTFESVVQDNQSESEESAASAKTLSDQANLLKSLIEEFELID